MVFLIILSSQIIDLHILNEGILGDITIHTWSQRGKRLFPLFESDEAGKA
jgi:hypothetical protein